MKRQISEKQLNKIINESINKHLNEFFNFSKNGNSDNTPDENPNGGQETLDYEDAIRDLQWLCQQYNLNFKDLRQQGNGIFAVTSPLDDNGKATGNIGDFLQKMQAYAKIGRLKEISGGISPKGNWYRKYQITANLQERRNKINEIGETPGGQDALGQVCQRALKKADDYVNSGGKDFREWMKHMNTAADAANHAGKRQAEKGLSKDSFDKGMEKRKRK